MWTVVLEISVLMAQYPSKEIAQGSYDYRTLGLGYANLGTVLMLSGIPYDSDKARAIAGAFTAILTGEAYATSAEMAGFLGPFPKYELNKKDMLRVMRNHRRAAYHADNAEYEGVDVHPIAINQNQCPEDLLNAAHAAWDKALSWGEHYGYRNAQTTVIAPTGTIGLLMDCDTTGVEPDFALVKFKKLAGGGYFKIANQSIRPALSALGYSENQIERIMNHVLGTMTLKGAPHINAESLKAKGFGDADSAKIEEQLKGVFELVFAFNRFSLGDDTLKRLGITEEIYTSPTFNLLKELGFTDDEIQSAQQYVCGTMTLEGAPDMKEEDLAVFDCANKCGNGTRYIAPIAHVKMMAAVQPFISGSISKTVNLPNEATVEEISDIYRTAWEWGVKAIALYRDGSKLSQPLNTKSDAKKNEEQKGATAVETPGSGVSGDEGVQSSSVETVQEARAPMANTGDRPSYTPTGTMPLPLALTRGEKRALPKKRNGITIESRVGGHKVFLRTGEYEDGTLGEIFIDMHKEGAAFRSMMNCFAIAISHALQYGVPLEKLIQSFSFTRFEPHGMTDHPNIKTATSVIDFIFRVLAMEYLGRTDLIHIMPEQTGTILRKDEVVLNRHVQLDVIDHPVIHEQTAMMELESQAADGPGALSAEGDTTGVNKYMSEMMGDAPACDQCGHITVRNGSCYKCLNCGNSLGCS